MGYYGDSRGERWVLMRNLEGLMGYYGDSRRERWVVMGTFRMDSECDFGGVVGCDRTF